MGDTSLVFNLVARDRASGEVSQFAERINAAAATVGAGFAAALGVGIVTGLNAEAAGDKLAAQMGLTPAESTRLGAIAGDLYAKAYGDSLEHVNAAVGAVRSSIRGMATASSADLEAASVHALDFAKTFEIDVAQGVQYVGTLINSGLAKDAKQGFDLITAASQRVPAHLREDLLEAADEYGQFFNTLGYSGEEAFSLLLEASGKGKYGIDKAGDAIKEFTLLSTNMSTDSKEAYKAIGLDAHDMANAILAGGDTAQAATQKIIDGLLKIKDPATQANAAIALFGTPLEDLNVRDIPAFLQSLKGASGGMDGFAGAADRAGAALNDNAGTALEQFKRKALMELGEVGSKVAQFALDNQTVLVPLTYTFAGLAATVLVVKAAMVTYSAVAAIVTGAHAVISASCWTVIGNWTRMMAIGLMAYVRIGAAAVASAAVTAASWTGAALASIGLWVAAVVRAAAMAIAQFALMAARAVVWAATMAAQWLIAMGPVGWIIAAVVALAAIIFLNWDKIKAFTGRAWDWVWGKVTGITQRMVNYILNLPIVRFFIQHWDKIKSGTSRKVTELLSFVRNMPSRIAAAIGNLGALLYSKGADVVRGLWSGISAMGGWLSSTLMSWARRIIPGPIARALGISSPSRVTAAQGRWIARGLIVGLTGSSKQVQAAAGRLADIVRSALAPGKKRTRALSRINSGTAELLSLARKEEVLAARLKTATKALADQIKARDELAASVRKGILDAANITSAQQDSGPVTASSILAGLVQKMQQAKRFAADLAALRKRGVRADLIAQIAQAGAEQGAAAAAALASASASQINAINSTQAQLVTAAGQAGAVAGDAMYGAGIEAARGLVKGLESQQRAIEAQMLAIAKGMQAAIRKALGIKSPSRVMAEVGRWVPAGVVQGVQEGRPRLRRVMEELVQPPSRPTVLETGRQMTAAAPLTRLGAGGGVVTVRFEFAGADGALKAAIQKIVRVDGRGDVQIAFGQK